MSVFRAVDSEFMELMPDSSPSGNMFNRATTEDSVFVQLKFSAEAGPVDLQGKLPYYDVDSSEGTIPVNFKIEYAMFDASSQTISLSLRTNLSIIKELNSGVSKILKGGAKAQITVEMTAVNAKQTVDQANKGTIVQFFDPQGAKFTMCESRTRQFQRDLAEMCGDSFRHNANQNDTEMSGQLNISGKWEKGTPISTWTSDSNQKVVVGIV